MRPYQPSRQSSSQPLGCVFLPRGVVIFVLLLCFSFNKQQARIALLEQMHRRAVPFFFPCWLLQWWQLRGAILCCKEERMRSSHGCIWLLHGPEGLVDVPLSLRLVLLSPFQGLGSPVAGLPWMLQELMLILALPRQDASAKHRA